MKSLLQPRRNSSSLPALHMCSTYWKNKPQADTQALLSNRPFPGISKTAATNHQEAALSCTFRVFRKCSSASDKHRRSEIWVHFNVFCFYIHWTVWSITHCGSFIILWHRQTHPSLCLLPSPSQTHIDPVLKLLVFSFEFKGALWKSNKHINRKENHQ